MSAQERELEQKTESKSSASSESAERVATEASSGKAELVAGFKKAIDALKLGGTSGITREFGKPVLIDNASANVGTPETKAKLYKTGELSKLQNRITKESRKLTHADLVQNDRTNNFVENQSNQTIDPDGGRNPESSGRNPESSGRNPESSGRNPESSGRNPDVVNMPAERITVSRDAAYHGETINRDVAPGSHTVSQGETLETISRQHLGADASSDEVQAHAREIERVNHIDTRHPLHPSQELTLPGHTRDGGYVNRDAAGNTHTRWSDNTERVESANGSGYVQRRAEDGSYTVHHWGHNPDENYELSRSADGRYLVADRPGEALHESSNPDDSRVAHARLSDLAESRISNPTELAQFRANMDQFEQRAREQHLPPDEVAKTYRQLDTLLEHTGSRPIPENQRIAIAEQVMDQAAHPTTIDQGQHLTCNVTAVETRLYTRNPSEAARLVTEVSTTGQFTARDGTVVHVPANSLHPDPEASHNPPEYGARSHASQVFQVTALNMYHQTDSFTYTDSHGRQHTVPPGGMRYEQHNPTPGRPNDHGERLIDTTTHPPTTVSRSADITEDGIVRVNNRLTGETGTDIMI
ncbi:MAG: LysM peptidoglycan-binding domain-containing protein, partial [Candidatus Obscuribacterales bacterium]|nr:LysM peptidoglycan-binding domain-containing protein [Candidatus Obscuribacterales bacterium]